MKKIINGLRYGNAKTKGYIIATLALLIFGIVSLVAVIMTQLPLWGMSTIFCFILAIIIMQSVHFQKTGEVKLGKKKGSTNVDNKKKTKETANSEEEPANEEEEETIAKEDELDQYDEKTVKKIMVKYKVNKDHRPIIIDSCNSQNIWQCPAYVWVEKGELKLLLFEKEPRRITISQSELTSMTYERNVSADADMDYRQLNKETFLKLIFSSYLPTLFEERIGQRNYRKNLYVIGKDFKITNTSAKVMMNLLKLNLSVESLIRDPKLHNVYFESAYALNIMLKDTVLSVSEYKTEIKSLLQKLTDAQINRDVFLNYMDQLVRARLITQEYAEYYVQRRK